MNYCTINLLTPNSDQSLLSPDSIEINFFVHSPAGDQKEKFGRQIKNFGHQGRVARSMASANRWLSGVKTKSDRKSSNFSF